MKRYVAHGQRESLQHHMPLRNWLVKSLLEGEKKLPGIKKTALSL